MTAGPAAPPDAATHEDWWPIRAEARLFDRLAAMPVRLRGASSPAEQGA